MKDKHLLRPAKQPPGFRGELVPEKDEMDLDTSGRYLKRNPYKTPPNNLTTKNK